MANQGISPSDQDLVRQVLNGHTNAFGELVRRYQGKIFRMSFLVTRNGPAAEDLSQEIFLAAFSSLPRFDLNRSFTNWILKIATNHCMNSIRRSSRPSKAVIEVKPLGSPEEEQLLKEEREKVLEALLQVEDEYKLVIWLYYFLERSYLQISEILDIPLHLVKIRLFRGKKMLGQLLKHFPS